MEHETAKEVMQLLKTAGSQISEALELTRPELSAEEFKHRCAATGQILGAMFFDLMQPISREHPDLDPDAQPT